MCVCRGNGACVCFSYVCPSVLWCTCVQLRAQCDHGLMSANMHTCTGIFACMHTLASSHTCTAFFVASHDVEAALPLLGKASTHRKGGTQAKAACRCICCAKTAANSYSALPHLHQRLPHGRIRFVCQVAQRPAAVQPQGRAHGARQACVCVGVRAYVRVHAHLTT